MENIRGIVEKSGRIIRLIINDEGIILEKIILRSDTPGQAKWVQIWFSHEEVGKLRDSLMGL